MISLQSHRKTAIPWIVESFGVLLLFLLLFTSFDTALEGWSRFLLWITAVSYAFARFCASRTWYPGEFLESGIGRHFRDMLTLTTYIMTVSFLLFLLAQSTFLLLFFLLVILLLLHINVILLVFHFHDHDPTPVNCFSGAAEKLTRDESVIKKEVL